MSNFHSGIQVTILGSGTCVPSLKRSASSVLLETGGCKILLDSGPGTMRRLLETGTRLIDLSYLFYSHFHPDHTGELATMLFAMKYTQWERMQGKLTVAAGKGFRNFYLKLQSAYGDWITLPPGILDIIELSNDTFDAREFGPIRVETAPVKHNAESIAYRIRGSEGRSVVYSGDTDYNKNLIELAKGADLLICESALPDELKIDGHLTPSVAGEIAASAGVGKLVLTHFYPECDQADIEKQCRKTYDGPLVLAEDLMKVEI